MSELVKALVQAQKIARAVGKDKSNSFHRYKYASAEAMIEEARGALAESGLAFRCIDSLVLLGEIPLLRLTYSLSHISGESEAITSTTPIIEEKGRPLDKAVATAKTYDLGYTLRGLLLLPRVEEEVDQRDDTKHEPVKPSNVVPIVKEMPMVDLLVLTKDIMSAKSEGELNEVSKRVAKAFSEGAISPEQRNEAVRIGKLTRDKLTGLVKT